jgi:cell division protein FtsB
LSVIRNFREANRRSGVTIIFQVLRGMKAHFSRFVYALAALTLASYAILALAGPRGIAAWRDKERQSRTQEKRNAELARENEQSRERIRRLAADPAEQERVVKERLKLVHPGDKVYVLPDDNKKK